MVGQSLGGAVAGVYAALHGASLSRISDSSVSGSGSASSPSSSLSSSSCAARSLSPLPPLAGLTMISPAVEPPHETQFARTVRTGDYSWLLPNSIEELLFMFAKCFHQPHRFSIPRQVSSAAAAITLQCSITARVLISACLLANQYCTVHSQCLALVQSQKVLHSSFHSNIYAYKCTSNN